MKILEIKIDKTPGRETEIKLLETIEAYERSGHLMSVGMAINPLCCRNRCKGLDMLCI